jgi:ribosome-associated toxin RatA of RatAB toxin-antitoxin module
MKRKIHFKKELDVNRQKAFDVVSKFDEYSEFLPGCTGSSLIKRDFPTEIGRLECNILGKEYFIISENTISEDSITINQIEGPFNYFEGKWTVEAKSDDSCIIYFEGELELPFLLNAMASQTLIDKFSSAVIEAFINRVS